MTRTQGWIVLVLVLATTLSFWWISEHSTGWRNYQWFQHQVVKQSAANAVMKKENQRLRQEMVALRYDHRLIEREARDLLALTREGEIVVHLPR